MVCAGKRAQDLPILASLARRKHRGPCELYPPFSVYVGAILFSVGSPRQNDIGPLGAAVTVMPLINHKSAAEIICVDLVGAEEVEKLDLARFAAGDDAVEIAASQSRHETEIEPADASRCTMQHIKPVPIVA